MDNIYNAKEITNENPIEEKISTFTINDTNNIIVSIINAPIGKVELKSSFRIIKDDNSKGKSIPLGHALFTGTHEEILIMLMKACVSILLKGKKKNSKQESKLIIPNKEIIK
jgi:hypothetical protein